MGPLHEICQCTEYLILPKFKAAQNAEYMKVHFADTGSPNERKPHV